MTILNRTLSGEWLNQNVYEMSKCMFTNQKLNMLNQVLIGMPCSHKVIHYLNQHFDELEAENLEQQLLAAKAQRHHSKTKFTMMIQTSIKKNSFELAYLFSPFILANLNQTVIYSTLLNDQVLEILKPYYHVEKTLNKDNVDHNLLKSLNLFLSFQDQIWTDQDFLYLELFNALAQAEVVNIILISDLKIDLDVILKIEEFFGVKIFQIFSQVSNGVDQGQLFSELQHLDMHQLLFKRKDEFYIELCQKFSELNAQILNLLGLYSFDKSKQLVEDMFYSEHIYEKLSVYAEYMQTQLQNKVLKVKVQL